MTDGTEECSGATARRLFGAAVSRVCGEEVGAGGTGSPLAFGAAPASSNKCSRTSIQCLINEPYMTS